MTWVLVLMLCPSPAAMGCSTAVIGAYAEEGGCYKAGELAQTQINDRMRYFVCVQRFVR